MYPNIIMILKESKCIPFFNTIDIRIDMAFIRFYTKFKIFVKSVQIILHFLREIFITLSKIVSARYEKN